MDELKLKSIVDAEIHNAMGFFSGELSKERSQAMKYYYGEPFGNEVEGRSKVVSTDVADTIEGIMPQIVKVFTASDEVVVFEPMGADDEEGSKQETDYVNYVFYKENDGFLILYNWIKDALLQKNGAVKVFWEESEKSSKEEYRGLTDPEYQYILADEDLELEEKEQRLEIIQTPQGPIEVPVYDCVLRRTSKNGKVKVVNVPPEELLVSPRAMSIQAQDIPFIAHKVRMTASDLKEMGIDDKTIEKIPSSDHNLNEESINRRNINDENFTDSSKDPSMREITVYECYLKVDFDEDGIAELRKVTLAGNEILINEEIDSVPFAIISPILMPHKYNGQSVADLVMDIQLIKSTLLRQILDNLYHQNNARHTVVNGQVNLEDLLESRPGGVVRQSSPGMVDVLPVTPFTGHVFGMMEYLDSMKEARSGFTRYNQGMDADSLNKTASGLNQIMTAAQSRVELIARVFAETGIRDLMLRIHELLQKHQRKSKVIKLRNRWVDVNPSEWKTRMNMTVNVGLGTGNKDQMAMHLQNVLAMQKELIAGGGLGILVTPENMFNALSRYVEVIGLRSPELFFQDPRTAQPPQQEEQPDPNIIAIQAQVGIEKEKRQIDMAKLNLQGQKDMAEMQLKARESMLREEIAGLKHQLEIAKLQQKTEQSKESHVVEIRNNDIQASLKELELALQEKENQRLEIESQRDAIMRKYEADIASLTQLTSQQMSLQAKMQESQDNAMSMIGGVYKELESLKVDNSPIDIELDERGKVVSVKGRKINRKKKGK